MENHGCSLVLPLNGKLHDHYLCRALVCIVIEVFEEPLESLDGKAVNLVKFIESADLIVTSPKALLELKLLSTKSNQNFLTKQWFSANGDHAESTSIAVTAIERKNP